MSVGDTIGANFDPSHLIWQGIDPVEAIRYIGENDHIRALCEGAIFVALAFFTMLMVRHGDVKVEAKRGLEAFDVDD